MRQTTMFDIPEPIEPLEVIQDMFNLGTVSDEIIVKPEHDTRFTIYGLRKLKRIMGSAMRHGEAFTAWRSREPGTIICAVWQEPERWHCYIEQDLRGITASPDTTTSLTEAFKQ